MCRACYGFPDGSGIPRSQNRCILSEGLDLISRRPLSQSQGVYHNHTGVGRHYRNRCTDAGRSPSRAPGMRDARETPMGVNARHYVAGRYRILIVWYPPACNLWREENALGWLLRDIVAQSGNITALDWVGRPSEFNNYLRPTSPHTEPCHPYPEMRCERQYHCYKMPQSWSWLRRCIPHSTT